MENKIKLIYKYLLEVYGFQGWWPIFKNNKIFYHLGDYNYPKNRQEIYEICLGCILTQNTSWKNVLLALQNLKKDNLLDYNKINKVNNSKLKKNIRCSGYYNQKTEYIKNFTKYFVYSKSVDRQTLLNIKGIGKETADSILLYAYKKPYFVIDTYTKRILLNLNLIRSRESYDSIAKLFYDNLEKDYKVYQEYHALLVYHAKKYYLKKENYLKDPLLKIIKKE